MKILLQNCTTRQFFHAPEVWVGDVASAHCFRSSGAALACALRQKLRDTQIVLKFPTDRYDITMAVDTIGEAPHRAAA
jgi:hypothetical protein